MQLKNLNGRKARMLLVYPDYTDHDSTNRTSGGNYSEGLASISAVLKEGGHSVSLLHLLNHLIRIVDRFRIMIRRERIIEIKKSIPISFGV